VLDKGSTRLASGGIGNKLVALETSNAHNPDVVPSQNSISSDTISHHLLNDNRDTIELHHAKSVIVNIIDLVRTQVIQRKIIGSHDGN